jgi:PAS domain S-box-containing protein
LALRDSELSAVQSDDRSGGSQLALDSKAGWYRYGLAAISCGLALAMGLKFGAPTPCFFLAVMVSSLYGGKGPSILSVVFSAAAYDYFFLLPRFSLAIGPVFWIRFAVFLGAILLVAGLIEAKRRAEASLLQIAANAEATKQRVENDALQAAFDEAKKSEAQLRAIINTIPALAWSALPDGSGEYFNQHFLDYVGLSEEQVHRWGWTASVHPNDVNGLLSVWQGIMASGEPGESEARLRRFDGEYRWFLIRANPLRDESGKIVKWYGINTDICDRKRVEEELRSSEEKHRIIVEAANDAVVSMDDHGVIVLANPATTKMFGYELVEILGKPMTILMPESMRNLHENGYKRYLATGERRLNWHGVEVTARRKDGQEFPVEVSFGEMASEGHKIFTGFIRDISEKKKAEETLRASEQSLRLIVDSIPGMICNMTSQGEFDLANRQFLEYTGKTVQEMKNWQAIVHPDDLPIVMGRLVSSFETGRAFDTEVRLRRADSEYRWFHCSGLPLRDDNGQIIRWYKLLTDIEDRKTAEEALRNSQTQLSRATRTATVGELAASIAHEINQPLAAVVANGHACLRWLGAQPPDLAKAQEAAERIARDGKEAGEVVRRIRALFKQAPLEKAALDLNEIIGEVLRLLVAEATKKRIIVETDLSQDLGSVKGDQVQLQQLIFNLLLNGIEAMDAVVDRPKRLFIRSTLQNPETVLVEIQDWGVGLSDSMKVFDAFFTTKGNGMGMGLTICRSIIEAHHGRLWAASTEGSGTTFSFTLPAETRAHNES